MTDPFAPETPPPDSGPRVPEGLVLGVAAVVAALVVLGGLYVLVARDDRSDRLQPIDAASTLAPTTTTEAPSATTEAPSTTAPTTEVPTSETPTTEPPAFEPIACPSGTDDVICDAVAFVETARGRPFQEFPTIELEEDAEFDRRLLAEFEEDAAELAIDGEVLRSLGLIGPDDDLVELFRDALEIGVVGYYDFETRGLVVRGSEFDLYSQLVLVHELVHAHDDQWIGLDRPEYDDVDDESDFGFTAITEGNASRIENEWRDSLSSAEEQELSDLELSQFSAEDIRRYFEIPPFILAVQISPYTDGLDLVEQIAASGGEEAVDQAFEDPPETSEQVLHPEQYLSDAPVELPAEPPADGEIIADGVFGELGFRHWLSNRAAVGWGGDRYVTWEAGGEVCTRIDVTADTPSDLDEIESAATAWAADGNDRSVERVGELVRITGCV